MGCAGNIMVYSIDRGLLAVIMGSGGGVKIMGYISSVKGDLMSICRVSVGLPIIMGYLFDRIGVIIMGYGAGVSV